MGLFRQTEMPIFAGGSLLIGTTPLHKKRLHPMIECSHGRSKWVAHYDELSGLRY